LSKWVITISIVFGYIRYLRKVNEAFPLPNKVNIEIGRKYYSGILILPRYYGIIIIGKKYLRFFGCIKCIMKIMGVKWQPMKFPLIIIYSLL
jgi:hypothetical protein